MITILRAGALGDVVLTLPAIHALRERYPGAGIRVIGYPAIWEVAGDLVDEVLSIDDRRVAGLYGGGELSADCELLIAWTARDLAPGIQNAGIPIIHASPYPPPGMHASDWLVETLSPLHIAAVPNHSIGDWGDSTCRVQGPVLLHPGAGAEWKRWPAARYAEVANGLLDQGHDVGLIEGPADQHAVAAVQAHARAALPVVREPSLRALAEILAGTRLVIGNDSGVSHLAASTGARTIAIFGPTDPVSWRPRGAVTVLRACSRHAIRQGKIRVCNDPACLHGVTVGEVLEAAGRVLAGDVENHVENVALER